jgi:hypothetical protein
MIPNHSPITTDKLPQLERMMHAVEVLRDLQGYLEQDGEVIAAIEVGVLKDALDLIQNRLYFPTANL